MAGDMVSRVLHMTCLRYESDGLDMFVLSIALVPVPTFLYDCVRPIQIPDA